LWGGGTPKKKSLFFGGRRAGTKKNLGRTRSKEKVTNTKGGGLKYRYLLPVVPNEDRAEGRSFIKTEGLLSWWGG